jgi:hypothetical protein
MAISINLLTKLNDSGIKDAESKFKNFGKKAAIGIGVGAGAAVVLGTKLIGAGEDASTANSRINQIADSMGLFSKEITGVEDGAAQVTDRLVDLANATARATGMDQNSIKQAQATLLTFGEIGQSADQAGAEFDRATKAAIDLAAAGFGTVEGNATQLGKALNDPIKGLSSLSKSGVTFTDGQKDMIKSMVEAGDSAGAQRLVLEAIEQQVGGTAEATANGSDRMRVAFSQLMENVGMKLLPVFEKFVGFMMEKVMPAIDRVIEVFGEDGLSGVFAMFTGMVKEQGPKVLSAIGDALGVAFNWIKDTGLPMLWDALQRLGKALIDWIGPRIMPMLSAIGGFIAAAAAWLIDTGLPTLWEKLQELGQALIDWIGPRIGPMLESLGEFIGEALNWLYGTGLPRLVSTMADLGLKLVSWIIDVAPDVLTALGEFLVNITKWVVTDGIPAFLGFGLDIASGMIDGLWEAITKFANRLLDFGKEIVSKIVSGITSAAGSIGSAVLNAIPGGGVIGGAIGGIKKILPFADGGIVTGPTLGLVGEAGPEAIIPLSQLGNVTGGSGVTVMVQGSVISEGDLVERIRRGLVESQRGGRRLVA